MTTNPPPPGSPWAVRCPDAYPVEWFDALGLAALPAGFARFATDDESALIRGAAGGGGTRATPIPRLDTDPGADRPVGQPAPARGDRFRSLNGFIDGVMRDLTRSELSVWLVLFRDVKADTGLATVSQASVAGRVGVSVRCVQKALRGLTGRGLVTVVRRGRLGAGASVYRVSARAGC